MSGLSIILRGTIDDRLNWAFNLYDLNKDGCITKEVGADIHRARHSSTSQVFWGREQDPKGLGTGCRHSPVSTLQPCSFPCRKCWTS